MRHKIDVPTIISPKQRVPKLKLMIYTEQLEEFIRENQQELFDMLNIFRMPKQALIEYVSSELISSLTGFNDEEQRNHMASEVADKAWNTHLKPKLVRCIYDDLVKQAIAYTHQRHIEEIPFEDGAESRERLKNLVLSSISYDHIMTIPVQLRLKPSYQVIPEDLQGYLDELFTETVREIFQAIHVLEEPLEVLLFEHFFNDAVPTKFSLDILERFHKDDYRKEEIIEWALAHPDFWFQELLSLSNRNIDRDPNISGDEKVTQKAAAYQFLKSVFLDRTIKEEQFAS